MTRNVRESLVCTCAACFRITSEIPAIYLVDSKARFGDSLQIYLKRPSGTNTNLLAHNNLGDPNRNSGVSGE